MGEQTTYKRSFAGSVGAGMKSVFSGNSRSYYILEHKVSSLYHKAGEEQEIIVDQIELGRDPKCQVRFDEKFNTVSRRHAAIVRDGQNWKLVQLSKTNTTFLNGRPIATEWYLQTGDEIQLAVNGPKLGFIIPTGKKATVGSIGLSRRLSLFRQQALRPYRTAMWIMTVALVLIIAGSVAGFVMSNKTIKEQGGTIEKQGKLISEQQAQLQHLGDSIKDMKQSLKAIKFPKQEGGGTGRQAIEGLRKCQKDVYYLVMYIRLEIDDVVKEGKLGTGTGFLLKDGRFITARHCVQPWMYLSDDDEFGLLCNIVHNNGGKMTCTIDAYSPEGKVIHFTSDEAVFNSRNDQEVEMDNGYKIKVAQFDCNDYAYIRTNKKGSLTIDAESSVKLKMGQELCVLGYPLGLGADNQGVKPYFSEAKVARDGISDEGYISTTATSFEQGNSGGPVFIKTKSGYKVVGIVSAGAGRSTGFVVPISQIH